MKRRKRTRTQREIPYCFKLLEVRFDHYVVVLWTKRCHVTLQPCVLGLDASTDPWRPDRETPETREL